MRCCLQNERHRCSSGCNVAARVIATENWTLYACKPVVKSSRNSPDLSFATFGVQYRNLTPPLSNWFISLVAVAGFQFPDDDDHDDRMMVITARCRCVTLNVDSSERVFLLLYRASLIVVNRHCSRSRISGCRKNCGRVNAAKFVKVVQPLQNIG